MKKTYLTGLILFSIYALAVIIRIGVCVHHQDKYDFFPFTSESALLYRYARIAAQGQSIPEIDYMAQHPEGLPVWRNISVGIELVMGCVYRCLPEGKLDFHSFARYFTPFFFCLGIVGIYLVTSHILKDKFSGLTASLFYAVCLPAVIRSTGQEISKENFALPLIIFHIWFFLKAWDQEQRSKFLINSLTGGLVLITALIWWEGTQIYFYILATFVVFKYLINKADPALIRVFVIQIVFCSLAGVLSPYLRAHYFVVSYPMLISLSLIAAILGQHLVRAFSDKQLTEGSKKQRCLIGRLISKYKRTFFLLTAVIFVLSGLLMGKYTKIYSHVQTLLYYKIMFLNKKPLLPGLIPYEARILWLPDLLKPGWSRIGFYFSTTLFLSLVSSIAAVYRFIKKKSSPGEGLIILGLVSTGLLYLFFNRVHVYLIIFVCIFIGYSGWLIKRKLPKLYALWLIFIGFCLCFETAKITANVDSLGRGVEYKVLNQTIDWVKNNTAEDDVLLSHFNVSPPFLTYADRAIALHPKFESPGMRAKVKEYAFALFSEKREEFYDFCIKKKVNYFIYPMGTFSERSHLGWRYITATPADARGTSAYKLEKFNSGLDNFVLVYRNWKYKIYKVYGPEELSKAKDYYTAGNDYLNKNRYEAAALEYKKALEVYPGYFQARVKLGTACYKLGDEDTAKSLWKQAHRLKEERLK